MTLPFAYDDVKSVYPQEDWDSSIDLAIRQKAEVVSKCRSVRTCVDEPSVEEQSLC